MALDEIKKWRVLVSVICLEKDGVWVAIPGWKTRAALFVDYEELAVELGNLEVGQRLHVRCNIGCDDPDLIEFCGWENE